MKQLKLAIVLTILIFSGCAQQGPVQEKASSTGSESKRASSYDDTLNHVRGRGSVHAPAQIQLGIGEKDKKESQQQKQSQDRQIIESRQVRELLEPRTFLGTVPCPLSDRNCQPLRVSLTFAPAGIWRLRAQHAQPQTDQNEHFTQGCWYRIGTDPTRIVLISSNETVVGDFTFLHDRQLKVNRFNQNQPLLDTMLTRQRDIDPINELNDQPKPVCQQLDETELDALPEELIIPELN